LMSGNAPANGPEYAMTRHMSRQRTRGAAREASDCVCRGSGRRQAQDCRRSNDYISH
jgi:hypothetical protein